MSDSAPRILVFAGSARAASFNKKLATLAARAATEAGAEVTHVDLRDFPMPLYDGDLEDSDGLPATAKEFKELLCTCDGFLIASPEYNSSITPLLKNSLDWASRSEGDDEKPLRAYTGKAAGLLAASPGKLGGLRGLVHLRSILGNIGVTVVPTQVAVASASDAFDEAGELTNSYYAKQVGAIAKEVADLAAWLRSRAT